MADIRRKEYFDTMGTGSGETQRRRGKKKRLLCNPMSTFARCVTDGDVIEFEFLSSHLAETKLL